MRRVDSWITRRERLKVANGSARIECSPISAVNVIVREVLARGIRITCHSMKRERFNRPRKSSIGVSVFGPSIYKQKKAALPILWQGWQMPNVKSQANLIS